METKKEEKEEQERVCMCMWMWMCVQRAPFTAAPDTNVTLACCALSRHMILSHVLSCVFVQANHGMHLHSKSHRLVGTYKSLVNRTHLKSVVDGLDDDLFRCVLGNIETQFKSLSITGVLY